MIPVIIISILSIVMMIALILKFPSLRIKGFQTDTFYLPILLGALILLIFPLFDKTELVNVLFSNSSLNPLKILILFICVSLMSISLDEAGFFNYIAYKFITRFKSNQIKLFIAVYVLISILTIFTSNDIVILTFTPFILYFSKRGNINPIPYLVMEFVGANTYSMILSIGNPTNIYLASVFNISFLDYFIHMIIPGLLIGLFTFITLLLLFYKKLKEPINVFEMSDVKLKNKLLCIVSLIHLSLTTILLAISNYIHIEMWIICLIFATSLLIFLIIYSIIKRHAFYVTSSLRRVPYSLIPFILSMFVIIMALDSYGVFENIRNLIDNISNEKLKAIVYLISSDLSCNILNNIPMTLAYGSILGTEANLSYVYATIIGSNVGAMLTPIGALAGIMWLRILKHNEVKYSFIDFMKNGSLLTASALLAGAIAIIII